MFDASGPIHHDVPFHTDPLSPHPTPALTSCLPHLPDLCQFHLLRLPWPPPCSGRSMSCLDHCHGFLMIFLASLVLYPAARAPVLKHKPDLLSHPPFGFSLEISVESGSLSSSLAIHPPHPLLSHTGWLPCPPSESLTTGLLHMLHCLSPSPLSFPAPGIQLGVPSLL